MADIAQRDFTKSLFALLTETFEGPGGNTYLDQGAGLFQTLDVLTAKGASHVPYVGAQTIAAHCAHLAYYVRVNHDGMMGREQHLDWPSSWRPQQVGDREWEELKGRVRREYDALIETLASLETWSEQQVGDSMAIVAHTAYHLGAIRHAMRAPGIERSAMKRTWTIIGVRDVPGSCRWYQSLFGQPETPPGHDHFGQILDTDGTVLLCLHQWGAHEHPSLMSPDAAPPGNGLLLFFRVDDFDMALKRARALVTRLEEEPHVNPNTQTREFSLRDPDGYYVTISSARALPAPRPARRPPSRSG